MSRLYACSRQGSSTFYKTGGERKRAKMSKRVGCKAAVKIKLKGTEWFYENVELEHNHALNPNPYPVIMEYVDDLQQSGVSPIATMNVLATLNGDPELLPMNDRDLENRRAANLREEQVVDVKKLMAFFSEYRTHNPKFYYDIEFDSAGVVKNIFWSHASCQANYAEFGDVVTFDTTYRSNFYCMPLGMFVGSNHHLQNVIFGFVLVRDETQKTFEWVFRTFKNCMEGKDPICILTDQDQAMANALQAVFVRTIHRLCRWHMLNKHTESLNKLYHSNKGLEEKLLTAVNHPLTPAVFENAWQEMVSEYELESDPTLCSLYELRASWIASYFKDIFCGRMTSTQRSECMDRMVKRHHVDDSTPLHVFAKKMYQVLQRRKDAEGQETIASQAPPATKTNYPLERQLSRIYTRAVFKKYQEAYVAGTSFRTKNDGPLLINEQIQKLPSKYVLRRYTRNAHIDLHYDRNDTIQTGNDGLSKGGRNSNMLRQAYATIRAGIRSIVGYERYMTVMKELREQLEEIPADEMPVRDETANDDPPDLLGTILKALRKSSTKGSRAEDGAAPIIGARGPKMCTRTCSNCGLQQGHNKKSCPHPPQKFAVGGTSAGRGRDRGRGRGRGRNARGKGVVRTRRRLLDDEEDEDDHDGNDEEDSESPCGSDSSA
ncbi:hypothetical protein BRADI_3g29324v3 [Brachypodium distachyon]|uniref:Protein FAR1-RELATED SEQUENCE n=1 Tax=Brachypodium distachyon TaxID=15368 RepID=A0A2K2CZY2_BRADI|nr:hypothetical protein BRADI_3g29324v3 [Brachypodium distachyon]